MGVVALQNGPTKIEGQHLTVDCFGLRKTIEKVATATVSYFRRGALYILPLVMKLTRSKWMAQSIINGAFSGLVLDIAFVILRLPRNNFALNCLSGYLFRRYFDLFEES